MTGGLPRWHSFWRNVTQRRRVETELHDELQSYLQLLIDEKVRGGMGEQEARRAALLELGGAEQIKEEVRDVKIGLRLDALFQDVRFGIRSLLKSPGLTAVALFSLAMGIGVNASLFSLVDRLVLTTLPVHDPGRLNIIFSNNRTGLTDNFSYPDFEVIRSTFGVFDGIFARMERQYTLDIDRRLLQVRAEIVTGGYFEVLGPKEFSGTGIGDPPDVFFPVHALPAIDVNDRTLQVANSFGFQIVARLKPGVSEEQARAELWNRIPNFDPGGRALRSPASVRSMDIPGSCAFVRASMDTRRFETSTDIHLYC